MSGRGDQHVLRQFRFILPGALATYFLHTYAQLWLLLVNASGWAWFSALLSVTTGSLSVGLMLYILVGISLKGAPPDFKRWRESGELSIVIPTLTASMIVGWSTLTYTLAYWAGMGFIEGIIGSSGLYALAFGLCGLIPVPRIAPP